MSGSSGLSLDSSIHPSRSGYKWIWPFYHVFRRLRTTIKTASTRLSRRAQPTDSLRISSTRFAPSIVTRDGETPLSPLAYRPVLSEELPQSVASMGDTSREALLPDTGQSLESVDHVAPHAVIDLRNALVASSPNTEYRLSVLETSAEGASTVPPNVNAIGKLQPLWPCHHSFVLDEDLVLELYYFSDLKEVLALSQACNMLSLRMNPLNYYPGLPIFLQRFYSSIHLEKIGDADRVARVCARSRCLASR